MEKGLYRQDRFTAEPFTAEVEVIIGIVLYLVSLFGTVGNICLIVALRKNKRLKNASNLLTISLAASDLLIAMVAMPISGYAALNMRANETFNDTAKYEVTPACYHGDQVRRLNSFLCPINGFTIYVSSKISTWTLAVMALERYIFVVYPLSYKRVINTSRMALVIISIWVLSVAVELPQTVFDWFPYVYYFNAYGCLSPSYHHMKYKHINFLVFSLFKKFFLNFVPTPLIGFCYYKILDISFKNKTFDISLKKRLTNKKEKTLQHVAADKGKHSRKRRLTTHESINQIILKTQQKYHSYKKSFIWLVIFISYLVCWSPVSTLGIAMNFYDVYCEQYFVRGIAIATFIIAVINCCLNPVIYGFLHQQVRRTFVDMVKCNDTDDRLRAEQQKEYFGEDTVILSRLISSDGIYSRSFSSSSRSRSLPSLASRDPVTRDPLSVTSSHILSAIPTPTTKTSVTTMHALPQQPLHHYKHQNNNTEHEQQRQPSSNSIYPRLPSRSMVVTNPSLCHNGTESRATADTELTSSSSRLLLTQSRDQMTGSKVTSLKPTQPGSRVSFKL